MSQERISRRAVIAAGQVAASSLEEHKKLLEESAGRSDRMLKLAKRSMELAMDIENRCKLHDEVMAEMDRVLIRFAKFECLTFWHRVMWLLTGRIYGVEDRSAYVLYDGKRSEGSDHTD